MSLDDSCLFFPSSFKFQREITTLIQHDVEKSTGFTTWRSYLYRIYWSRLPTMTFFYYVCHDFLSFSLISLFTLHLPIFMVDNSEIFSFYPVPCFNQISDGYVLHSLLCVYSFCALCIKKAYFDVEILNVYYPLLCHLLSWYDYGDAIAVEEDKSCCSLFWKKGLYRLKCRLKMQKVCLFVCPIQSEISIVYTIQRWRILTKQRVTKTNRGRGFRIWGYFI